MPQNNLEPEAIRVEEELLAMMNRQYVPNGWYATVNGAVTQAGYTVPQVGVERVYMTPADIEQINVNQVIDGMSEEELLKSELKKRHLNGGERRHYHKPKSDWQESPAGEVCRNAETLVVSDIVSKYVTKK